ncbi:hypothetical protein RND81_05G038500 [Saponaria officinalis]|uniref:Pentatricopeptide repeat-containing protein n=1 Tax=Saponaria officinalis TaxID=3572 RepID=A0AAW1KQK5_SAPOF
MQKLLKVFGNQVPSLTHNQEIAKQICNSLTSSSSSCLKNLQESPVLSNVNSHIIHIILSDQNVPVSSTLQFFRLLQNNPSFSSQKPDLRSYLTLICRLLKARDFTVDQNLRCPVSDMGSILDECCGSSVVIAKYYDLLMRVYADDSRFDDAFQVFDEMSKRGFVVEERTCMKMVSSGVKVTVHLVSILVDRLCKKGYIKRARQMVIEASGWGVQMNAYAYNSLIEFYMKKHDFGGVGDVLKLMQEVNMARNAATYTVLINGYETNGKMEEAKMVYEDLSKGGVEVDVYLYTALISRYCKKEDMKQACRLFDEMAGKKVAPTSHTYGALINAYNSLASGLCKLNRHDDANRLLYTMLENGLTLNTVNYTTLVDIHCKEGNFDEAKWLIREMEDNGESPNVVTYNCLIDGYCKNGRMKENYALKDEMEGKELMPDVYTYTSLIHGECMHGKLEGALRMFNDMISSGPLNSCIITKCTPYINLYIKCTYQLSPNVVTYTVMISGLCKEGRSDKAFKLYDQMIDAGFTADSKVYISLVGSLH